MRHDTPSCHDPAPEPAAGPRALEGRTAVVAGYPRAAVALAGALGAVALVSSLAMAAVPFDAAASAEKTCRLMAEAASNGAELVLFPEAFLGTYPKGLTFDAPVGRRLPEGREDFLR